MTDILLLAFAVALVLATLWMAVQYFGLQANLERRAVERYEEWREAELEQVRRQEARLAEQGARLMFEQWRQAAEAEIRRDAVQRSDSVNAGKTTEHLVPHMPGFGFNPRDARFIGSPIDFVVFDGLSEGEVRSICFVEVKTGRGSLSTRERRVRDAIMAGKVGWKEQRVDMPAAGEEGESGAVQA